MKRTLIEQLKEKRDALNNAISILESMQLEQNNLSKLTTKPTQRAKPKKASGKKWSKAQRARFSATMRRKNHPEDYDQPEQRLSDFIHNEAENQGIDKVDD